MRAESLLSAALAGAVALAASSVAPQVARAEGPEAHYEPVSRTLVIAPPPGAAPTIAEAHDPPRLVVEWRGTATTVPRGLLFGAGLVYRFVVEALGDRTRVTLFMRAPLDGGWSVSYAGGRTIVRLLPGDPEAAYVPPLPARTPRPAPGPVARITPVPLWPLTPPARALPGLATPRPLPPEPTWYPDDRLRVPAPFPHRAEPGNPTPGPTLAPVAPAPTAPPLIAATPVPAPTAIATPVPLPSLPATVTPERAVFGSALFLGAEPRVGFTETFPAGGSEISAPLALGGSLGWDHMFSESLGLSITGRTFGFAVEDELGTENGFQVRHKRDDFELGAGVRGRMPFGGGVEGFLQPGLLVRYARSSTTHALVAAGTPGAPVEVDTTDWLTASWLGYGASLRGGLGWRVAGPFALAGFGEYRLLADGTILTRGVPRFFPFGGWRLGGEARLDLDGWGLVGGYALGNDSFSDGTAANSLQQGGGTAYLRAQLLY